jgi:hypothetical protein
VLSAVSGSPAAAAAAAPSQTSSALLQSFLEALSGLGLGLDGLALQQQQQQQPLRRRQQQQQRLVLTLKIAGVHWWYNSTSHASELTAGYYNTDTRDGYSPILQLCEKHGVNLTLTCVEMCDAQHPSYALCGPEGLLRQIRAMAAKQQVTLSGENALPIFTPAGVDAVALDRVVCNVRACRASPLRSCSSWPGPATTSGSSSSSSSAAFGAAAGGACNGSMLGYGQYAQFAQYSHHSQQYHHQQQQQQQYYGGGLQHSYSAAGVHGGYHHLSSLGPSMQLQQQQQHAYHHHYGAGMSGVGSSLSSGRTFSELGTILRCNAAAAAAAGSSSGGGSSSSSSGHWQQQQQQQQQLQQGYEVPGSFKGLHGANGAAAASNSNGTYSLGNNNSSSSSAAPGEVQLLPAMRAFTFLRLGPEILQPDCHANWMRFMHRMLNERA